MGTHASKRKRRDEVIYVFAYTLATLLISAIVILCCVVATIVFAHCVLFALWLDDRLYDDLDKMGVGGLTPEIVAHKENVRNQMLRILGRMT